MSHVKNWFTGGIFLIENVINAKMTYLEKILPKHFISQMKNKSWDSPNGSLITY